MVIAPNIIIELRTENHRKKLFIKEKTGLSYVVAI